MPLAPVEQFGQVVPHLTPGFFEALLAVDLLGVEVRDNLCRTISQRHIERIGERVGRVGRHHQRRVAEIRGFDRRRS